MRIELPVFLLVAVVLFSSDGVQADEARSGSLMVRTDKTGAVVTDGGKTLLSYRVADVPFKPYVDKFLSPAGANPLRDAPKDHLHHHGLMFAIAADGIDFWAETPECGRQVHRSFVATRAISINGKGVAEFSEDLDWVSPKEERILRERRNIQVYRRDDLKPALMTWRTTLEPATGKAEVKLTGSHYFGLGMRFVESMDKAGTWIYPERKGETQLVRGDERLVRADWCAYAAQGDLGVVTAAMLDHNRNPRHEATWFTMGQPFSYISATLNLSKEPLILKAGQKLSLCYGVAIWDGQVDAKAIDNVRLQWVEFADQDAPKE